MRPDWHCRAMLHTAASRVRAAPDEKTEASVIAIASPRPGVNRATGCLAAPVDGRRHVSYCTARTGV